MASLDGLLVNIDVDDPGTLIAFYGATFELSVGRRFGRGAVERPGLPVSFHLPADPFGNGFCPVQLLGRAYGVIAT